MPTSLQLAARTFPRSCAAVSCGAACRNFLINQSRGHLRKRAHLDSLWSLCDIGKSAMHSKPSNTASRFTGLALSSAGKGVLLTAYVYYFPILKLPYLLFSRAISIKRKTAPAQGVPHHSEAFGHPKTGLSALTHAPTSTRAIKGHRLL